MYLKIFLNFILIVSLVVVQLGLISGLPAWAKFINLYLIALIFILVIYDLKTALFWTVGVGVLLDFFSFGHFGVYVLALFSMVILADLMLNNFFTNRSLYSILALVLSAYFIFETVLYALSYLFDFLAREHNDIVLSNIFFLNKSAGLLMDLILTVLIFYFINIFSRKFKLTILKSKI